MNFAYPLRFSRWYKLLPSLSMAFTTLHREIWLTFDDGPVTPDTMKTLEMLAQYQAPATFFVLTERAIGERSLLREMAGAGHEIALHGWHHRRQLWQNGNRIFAEWCDSRSRIEQMLGKSVSRFRPPYAVPPLFCWSRLVQSGLKPVYLTWMLGDFVPTLQVKAGLARLRPKLAAGDILLLHDGGPAPHIFRTILPELLAQLKEDGWKFVIPNNEQLS